MAKYIVFIYVDEAQMGGAGADVIQSIVEGHQKFAEKHGASLRGGGRLAPGAQAVSLRYDSGRQPAPFLTDAVHRIGGDYVVEAPPMDEAARIARHVPPNFFGLDVPARLYPPARRPAATAPRRP